MVPLFPKNHPLNSIKRHVIIKRSFNDESVLVIRLKKNPQSIEKQLIVLYWDSTSKSITSGENNTEEELSENFWKITGKSIPVSFSSDTESLAFAVGICNKEGIQRFEELTCALELKQLGILERATLQNRNSENNNFLNLDISRKGSFFIEINEVTIQLDPESDVVRKLCLPQRKSKKQKNSAKTGSGKKARLLEKETQVEEQQQLPNKENHE